MVVWFPAVGQTEMDGGAYPRAGNQGTLLRTGYK